MSSIATWLKDHWWPVSAMVFCPCHLPLTMGGVAMLTAGTGVGAFISANYTSIESVLAVTFSFYFVLAFMIWAVRGPQSKADGQACPVDGSGRLSGLSTRQIVIYGVLGALVMPLLITASLFVREDVLGEVMLAAEQIDAASSGLIWLISISTVVMIPVMVIWIVWMWVAWTKAPGEGSDPDTWSYEYE